MGLRHFGSIALLAVMAVAVLFFFPAVHGSYSATHGPITALRASRLRVLVSFLIASAAAALASLLTMARFGRCFAPACTPAFLCFSPACSPLRC